MAAIEAAAADGSEGGVVGGGSRWFASSFLGGCRVCSGLTPLFSSAGTSDKSLLRSEDFLALFLPLAIAGVSTATAAAPSSESSAFGGDIFFSMSDSLMTCNTTLALDGVCSLRSSVEASATDTAAAAASPPAAVAVAGSSAF